MKILTPLLVITLFLGSCYKTGPDPDELQTIPSTNNPNILPGPQRPAPIPGAEY